MKHRVRFGLAAMILLCAVAPALAQQNPPPNQPPIPLAQHKQMIMARINQQMTIMQQMGACVQAAMTEPALRACMEQRRHAEEQLRRQGGE